MYSESEKKFLLSLARQTIQDYLGGRKRERPVEVSENLEEYRGVFVTLHKKGHLRGCIGHIEGTEPLWKAVADLSIESAMHDPRFPSVRNEELDDIDIEISVLTPLERIEDVEVVKVGQHGLYIKKGFFAGLLLPQVAVEWGWDRDKFLDQTCLKAGLTAGCWKDKDAEIYVFSAEIFGEKEMGHNE